MVVRRLARRCSCSARPADVHPYPALQYQGVLGVHTSGGGSVLGSAGALRAAARAEVVHLFLAGALLLVFAAGAQFLEGLPCGLPALFFAHRCPARHRPTGQRHVDVEPVLGRWRGADSGGVCTGLDAPRRAGAVRGTRFRVRAASASPEATTVLACPERSKPSCCQAPLRATPAGVVDWWGCRTGPNHGDGPATQERGAVRRQRASWGCGGGAGRARTARSARPGVAAGEDRPLLIRTAGHSPSVGLPQRGERGEDRLQLGAGPFHSC